MRIHVLLLASCLSASLPLPLPAHDGDYVNPYTTWFFRYKDDGLNALFLSDAFIIEVEDRNFGGSGTGSFVVGGPDAVKGRAQLGSPDHKFTWSYFNTVTKITLLGTPFEIIDGGKAMKVEGRMYTLAGEQPHFVLQRDGRLVLQDED